MLIPFGPEKCQQQKNPRNKTEKKVNILKILSKVGLRHQSVVIKQQKRIQGIIKRLLPGKIHPEMTFADTIKTQKIKYHYRKKDNKKHRKPLPYGLPIGTQAVLVAAVN